MINIQDLHTLFLESSGICTDTRKIAPNNLFFALSGENFNGNTFARKALDEGAFKAVIDDEEFTVNGKTVHVENALETLQKLANFHRKYLNLPIIALTGSNGKTTTKELINAVLSKKYKTVATVGNLNNHIGVPLTLLAMDKTTELGIVEMGANHLKEIENLCHIAEPNYGYITNFGKAHLEGFGSEEGIVQGKSELYKYIKATNGTLFINADDVKQSELSKDTQRFSFGENTKSDLTLSYPPALPFAQVLYENKPISSQLIGFYNTTNIAGALSIGIYFKVEKETICQAIADYLPSNNRSQIIENRNLTILLDAYNANPTSMEAALENFNQLPAQNKIVFLGDMFELGEAAPKEHEYIATLAIAHKYDALVLFGKNFEKLQLKGDNVFYYNDVNHFKDQIPETCLNLLRKKTHLLIKGSRGMALERLLPTLNDIVNRN